MIFFQKIEIGYQIGQKFSIFQSQQIYQIKKNHSLMFPKSIYDFKSSNKLYFSTEQWIQNFSASLWSQSQKKSHWEPFD